MITRPRLTGICGSDSKQILMDFGEDDVDNAMAAFCSFPQVMGHEVVADVVALVAGERPTELGVHIGYLCITPLLLPLVAGPALAKQRRWDGLTITPSQAVAASIARR